MYDETSVCIDSFEVKIVGRNRRWLCFFSVTGILILILDGKTALSGAAEGIELCLKTVIPALFPFMILSSVFLSCATAFPWKWTVFSTVFRFPPGEGFLALPCFLGGYPVGAQSVCKAYQDGRLQKDTAQKILAFANNAGPSFVFGVVGQMFPKAWFPWVLWSIHIVGALAAAHCLSNTDIGQRFDRQPEQSKGDPMVGAVKTTGVICGWVILFRVIIAFLNRWFLWFLPESARIALIGLLELSNGCCELPKIADIRVRFILCSEMLAAGGLCVTAQTASVTKGLSLRYYFLGKVIQILVSLMISCSIMYQTMLPILCLLPLFLLYFYRTGKKRSGNRSLSSV